MTHFPQNAIPCLNDGFVSLVDSMGSDASICNAARVSYGNHQIETDYLGDAIKRRFPTSTGYFYDTGVLVVREGNRKFEQSSQLQLNIEREANTQEKLEKDKDRSLIRYLMRHRHTTPFEMVSFIFLVRAPIHVARQWFRHRTWSYNEYSTRYKEAIDSFETTEPDKWRSQAKNNKQGSEGYIPVGDEPETEWEPTGGFLSGGETSLLNSIKQEYQRRLDAGVAHEQARKDLPLSTYTEFYAKVDLHNLFHFLSLRMDSHAQLEIREYAKAIFQLIRPIVPTSVEAFEDYRLNGSFFSAQEMEIVKGALEGFAFEETENCFSSPREFQEFKEKLEL